ncbi:MAG: DUF362 domain-containing protein [Candidatus Geothermarchaeales archaeon]
MTKVFITRGDDSMGEMVDKLSLDRKIPKSSKVFIKPNIRAAGFKRFRKGSITNPAMITDLVETLLDLGLEVTVGEGTSSSPLTQRAIENSGIEELRERGIDVLNLNHAERRRVTVPGSALGWIDVPLPILTSDYVISFPVMKTHYMTEVSLSLKNMVGVLVETEPNRLHCRGIHQSIADISTVLRPDWSIIDASWAMEGFGPVYGEELRLGVLVGGTDPLAVDVVGARIMGFDPLEIRHLHLAKGKGIGDFNPEVDGDFTCQRFVKPSEAKKMDFLDRLLASRLYHFAMCNKLIHNVAFNQAYHGLKSLIDFFES